MKKSALAFALVVLLAGLAAAQRFGGGFGGGSGRGNSSISLNARTAREVPTHSYGFPEWTNQAGFERDTFTFVRVKRQSTYGSGGSWNTDAPDSDLNFSYRLQQMTSLKVDPDGRFIWLTDKDLFNYPFIYMVEPGTLYLDPDEIVVLRKYLLNGGFLMLDDFWGEAEWANAAHVMKQVFPGRSFVELPLSHPLYQSVFPIRSKGQVPNINVGSRSEFDPDHVTWERYDAQEVHHRAIFDDQGRMMVIATHNTDNGDGWEREGENHYYFKTFSEPIAYPLGINIIFYAMTH